MCERIERINLVDLRSTEQIFLNEMNLKIILLNQIMSFLKFGFGFLCIACFNQFFF
jgi:hypothetical protein